MRLVANRDRLVTHSVIGLVRLKDLFDQRKVEPTYGSFRSFHPLRTPSGAQWTESEMESELLEQLAFCPALWDVITQPQIPYRLDGQPRVYTPDMALQLHASGLHGTDRFIVEVKRQEEIDRCAGRPRDAASMRTRFEAGRLAADRLCGSFRVMTERQIKTPYLRNARRLKEHFLATPEDVAFAARDVIAKLGPSTFAEAVAAMSEAGTPGPDALYGVEQAVAHRLVECDLSCALGDTSVLRVSADAPDPRRDPILTTIGEAGDGTGEPGLDGAADVPARRGRGR